MALKAHLQKHYTNKHNELVFGKILRRMRAKRQRKMIRKSLRGQLVRPADLPRAALIDSLRQMFATTWFPTRRKFFERIVRQAISKRATQKPKALICAAVTNSCVAAVAMLPKRGGAIKALLLTVTNDRVTLAALIRAVSWDDGSTSVLRSPDFLEESAGVHASPSLVLLHTHEVRGSSPVAPTT
jgi:hypothetical protein